MKAREFAKYLRATAKRTFVEQPEAIDGAIRDFHSSVDMNFARQEQPDGTRWPKHAPLTVLLHGPHPLLILTGRLKAAATGGSGSYRRKIAFKGRVVEQVGVRASAVPYAVVQQKGGRGSGGNYVPKRSYHYLNRRDRLRFVAEAKKRIAAKVRGDMGW